MPELPDVEYMLRGFKDYIIGKSVKDFIILDRKFVKISDRLISAGVVNSKIREVIRKGKYILVFFDSGFTLVLHMGMTGWIDLVSKSKEVKKHDKFRLIFKAGKEIRYNCSRKLGKIRLTLDERFNELSGLNNLGVDALSEAFTCDVLGFLLKKTDSYLKSFFINQSYIAGIGNVYADEILFKSRISPKRKTSSLNRLEVKSLYKNTKRILNKAISNYNSINKNNNLLLNRRKKGQKCPNCNRKLKIEKISGRTTFFCSKCQK